MDVTAHRLCHMYREVMIVVQSESFLMDEDLESLPKSGRDELFLRFLKLHSMLTSCPATFSKDHRELWFLVSRMRIGGELETEDVKSHTLLWFIHCSKGSSS